MAIKNFLITIFFQLQEKDKKIASEKEHALQLENELEEQGNMFFKKKEQWSVELSEEKSKSKDLEEKVISRLFGLKQV